MGRFIENKTQVDIEKLTERHTIGAFFRLLVDHVVDVSVVDHILYLDTDVAVIANLEGLWKHVDPETYFQWGATECSGFVLLNVPKIKEIWNLVSRLNITNWSRKLSHQYGDQLIFKAINHTFPNVVGILPPEWDVTVSSLWAGNLADRRPRVGMLHLNGDSRGEKFSAFLRGVMTSKKETKRNTWGLADYYVRMPWQWAKFQAENAIEGEGHILEVRHATASLTTDPTMASQ
jgi:hypothetical protein